MRIQEQARALVAPLAGELVHTVAELIRAPTVSGQEGELLAYLEAWFDEHGFDVRVQRLSSSEHEDLTDEPNTDKRANVIVRLGDAPGRPEVVINGHIDVVPPGDLAAWTEAPPFSGVIKDRRVYGRGAVDTKGGVGAAMLALLALKRSALELRVNVVLQLVVGEELTGVGTRVANESGPPDMAIVLEPTECAVAATSTGLQFFKVRVRGISAHTSSPWKGRDAFNHLLAIHRAMSDLASDKNNGFRSPLYATVPSAAPFAVGTVQAGQWRAAIPDAAEMAGRIGILPGEAVSELRESIEMLIRGIDELERWPFPTEIVWESSWSSWETPRSHDLVRTMLRSASLAGGPDRIIGLTAGSDAAFFGERQVPTVVFGPGEMALAHSPNEHVEEAELLRACTILVHTLLELGGENDAVASTWPDHAANVI